MGLTPFRLQQVVFGPRFFYQLGSGYRSVLGHNPVAESGIEVAQGCGCEDGILAVEQRSRECDMPVIVDDRQIYRAESDIVDEGSKAESAGFGEKCDVAGRVNGRRIREKKHATIGRRIVGPDNSGQRAILVKEDAPGTEEPTGGSGQKTGESDIAVVVNDRAKTREPEEQLKITASGRGRAIGS